ncbi:DUF123 domain-containing protein [uncultured Methanobrevibacter sp.]|uniref:GIY-YIG nuclease family protein n=1 Tax=uncultured Methanobrevibacter sp. TaxID=253161 RepID=UPI002610D7A8|nr:GIY-YIG nuclease family protein [uncultured Methanobrevibacter sp.]
MKGCYCLVIQVDDAKEIRVGKLGKIKFKSGYYVYVGSAMNSLEARLNRHLKSTKKLHWHVDYLLKHSEITSIIYNENRKVECEISQYLCTKTSNIEGFGCSDCDCESHLYYFENDRKAIECVKDAYDSIAIQYDFYEI